MSCGAAADCRIARRRERLLRLDRARALDVLNVLRQPRSSVKKKNWRHVDIARGPRR
jgi:hypothetical protein